MCHQPLPEQDPGASKEKEARGLSLHPGGKQRTGDQGRAIGEIQEKRLLGDLEKLKKRIEQGRLSREDKIYEAIGRLKERYPRVARYYEIAYHKDKAELTWAVKRSKEGGGCKA